MRYEWGRGGERGGLGMGTRTGKGRQKQRPRLGASNRPILLVQVQSVKATLSRTCVVDHKLLLLLVGDNCPDHVYCGDDVAVTIDVNVDVYAAVAAAVAVAVAVVDCCLVRH